MPPSGSLKYKLKQEDAALNFVYTNLTRANAYAYLSAPETGFGPSFTQPATMATTQQVTATGVELSENFLNRIKDQNQGVILCEGRTFTAKPLVLVVEKDGAVITEVKVYLTAVDARFVDRDDPTKTWVSSKKLRNETLYAGTESGDMVSWKVPLLPGSTYLWQATGPGGTVINGPSGSDKSEWMISDEDDDPIDWLKWRPGTYKISCTIQGGASPQVVAFNQEIGWRTDDLLIIGQIVPTEAHTGDEPSGIIETYQYERAVMNDVGMGGVVGTGASAVLSTQLITQLFFKYWGEDKPHAETPAGPFTTSYPDQDGTVLEKHRYWMVNYMLNLAPDDPITGPAITPQQLPVIIEAKQFRILHHYQEKFLVSGDGKIAGSSIVQIHNDANKGITKIVGGLLSSIRDAIQRAIGGETIDWGPLLQVRTEEAETSPYNDAHTTSLDGKKRSAYASARIGEKGRNANWRLFGKDAPWIYSEIIHELRPDHTVDVAHRLSVDIIWRNNQYQGETPFNNLNIYKRQFNAATQRWEYLRQGLPLPMEGELRPFIDSASGQWPEPAIPPSVP